MRVGVRVRARVRMRAGVRVRVRARVLGVASQRTSSPETNVAGTETEGG